MLKECRKLRFVRGALGLVCLTLLLGSPAVPTAAAATKKVVIAHAGYFFGWGLIYVAAGKGFFAQHGLEVELLSAQGGPQVLAAVLAGRADFSTSSILEVIEANLQGQKVRIASPLTRQSQVACAIRADLASQFPPATASWSERVKALRGKQVGVTSVGGGVSLALNYMLRGAGMTERDVVQTAIGADPAAWIAALRNKQLDAMCAGIPIPEEAIVQGIGELFVSPALGDVPALEGLPEASMATTQAVIDRDPEMVQSVVAALYDAMKFLRDNPREAAAAIKEQAFPRLNPKTFDLGFAHFSKAFAISPRVTDAQMQVALNYISFIKGRDVKLSLRDVYDNRFAERLGQ